MNGWLIGMETSSVLTDSKDTLSRNQTLAVVAQLDVNREKIKKVSQRLESREKLTYTALLLPSLTIALAWFFLLKKPQAAPAVSINVVVNFGSRVYRGGKGIFRFCKLNDFQMLQLSKLSNNVLFEQAKVLSHKAT